MLITNWLNSVCSRIQRRPRYNSRTRRAIRKRWQAVQHSQLTTAEVLEERQMLTTTLFLDFGAGLFANGAYNTTVDGLKNIDGTGYNNFGTGTNFTKPNSSVPGLVSTDNLTFDALPYDFDGNGTLNLADYTAFADAVVPLIERSLEPFDIDVQVAASKNFTEVQNLLGQNDGDLTGEFDAYVFISFVSSTASTHGQAFIGGLPGLNNSAAIFYNEDGELRANGGKAAASDLNDFDNVVINGKPQYHQGNKRDEVSVTHADAIYAATNRSTSAAPGTDEFNSNFAQRVAYTTTHEAFHTFSFIHTEDTLDGGDVIELGSLTREDPFMVTRFELERQADSNGNRPEVTTKNNYDLIATDSDIGLRDDDGDGIPNLAYITGTGAHDRITVTKSGVNTISVTVDAYYDAAKTIPLTPLTITYSIDLTADTEGEILIDAGVSDDEIVIDASIDASFRIRGGAGTDSVRLTGSPDELKGVFSDSGNFSYEVTNSSSQRTITFEELEELNDETVLADKFFIASNLDDSLLLTNAAATSKSTLQFSASQSINFVNPTGTLNLDLGVGNDTVEVSSIDPGFNGAFLVTGNSGNDLISISNSITVGGITFAAETIQLDEVIITTTNDQIYDGVVSLIGNTTINSADVYFQNTIISNNSSNLVVNANGGSATATINTGSFVKDGTGLLRIQGANNFNSTSIANGILRLGASNILDDTSSVTVSGGTLDLGTFSDSVTSVTLQSGEVKGLTGVLTSLTNYVVESGTVSAILGGTVGLTKNTTGTVTLNTDSIYTGTTTINAGTLNVESTLSSGVTINTGGILGGDGNVTGTVSVVGGAIAPGSGPGILDSANITFTSGSAFNVDLNGLIRGEEYDQLNVAGTIDLGGATLNVTLNGFSPDDNDGPFTIIKNDSVDPITGIFSGLPEGTDVDFAGTNFRISYTGGDGNDVVLTANTADPLVTSIINLSPSLNNNNIVRYRINFSEVVSGLQQDDLVISHTGSLTNYSISSIQNYGSYSYVFVNTGDNTGTEIGTLRLDVIDNDTVTDIYGNPLGGAGTVNGDFTTGSVYTIDFIAPGAPVILSMNDDTGVSSSDLITNDNTPIFSGTAEVGSTIQVRRSDTNQIIGTATTDSGGNWTTTFSTGVSLVSGTYTFTATAKDVVNNESTASTSIVVTFDFEGDIPVFTGLSAGDSGTLNDQITNEETFTLQGTAEANGQVEIFLNEISQGTVSVDALGIWSYTYTANAGDGVYAFTAITTDVAGNLSNSSDVFAITLDNTSDAPVMIGVIDDTGIDGRNNVTQDQQLTLYGTAEAGSTVTIHRTDLNPDLILGTTTADASGNWEFEYNVLLAAGTTANPETYTFKATTIDAAGNPESGFSNILSVDIVNDSEEDAEVRVELRVVSNKTSTDASGETINLPDSDQYLDEWNSYWVEIWLSTPYVSDAGNPGIKEADFNLTYDSQFTSAIEIEFGAAFTTGQGYQIGTEVVDGVTNDTGSVTGITATANTTGLGVSEYVLFARVKFDSTSNDQVNLEIVEYTDAEAIANGKVTRSLKTADPNFGVTVNEITNDLNNLLDSNVGGLYGGVHFGTLPTAKIVPNFLDFNDSDRVDFRDLQVFASAYNQSVVDTINSNGNLNRRTDTVWLLDYNKGGRVDFRDLMLFAAKYNTSKTNTAHFVMPADFPDLWFNSESEIITPASTLVVTSVTMDEDANSITVEVTNTKQLSEGLSVDVETTGSPLGYTGEDSATDGTDFDVTSGTLNFAGTAGEKQYLTIPLTNDSTVELDEKIYVSLDNLLYNGDGHIDSFNTEVIIRNDDNAQLSIDDLLINEGQGTATFTVTLDKAVDTAFTVDFATADKHGVAGLDYVASSGTLNFAGTAGETQTITVTINEDTTAELDESFFVNLSNIQSSGRPITLADSQGVGTISGNDTGTAGDDNFLLRMNADGVTLELLNNLTLVESRLITDLPGVTIDGGSGDDTLTLDFSNGIPFPVGAINFNGGANTASGDRLSITKGSYAGTFGNITHTFTSNGDGSINIDGQIINYTGIEPITDDLVAADRVFDFTGAAETITLSDNTTASDGLSLIDSTLSESVEFAAATNSLTILTENGTGANVVNVNGRDSLSGEAIMITGDSDDDVTFQTNNVVMGANNLTVTGQTITVNSGITSTSGAISLTASRNIVLNTTSTLTTIDGGITLVANTGGLTTGDFIGIDANNASIQSTGTGNISFTSISGNGDGIYLHGGTSVTSTATDVSAGTISLNGTGGGAANFQHGVLLIDASISSVDGAISLTGQGGGDGTGDDNNGLYLYDSNISSTGSGVYAASITLDGTAGNGIGINRGIRTALFSVSSVDGDISITGQGVGDVTGADNEGIVFATTTIASTGNAAISIHGSAGAGLTYNQGVYVTSTDISSVNADISLISDGHLWFDSTSDIMATSGNLQVVANYLSANNTGNLTIDGNAVFSTGAGNIDLDAAGDISLTSLVATGTVSVDSISGSILDNDDTNIDISAATAALNAAGSIGTVGDPLTTRMDAHTAVSGTSDVNIDNRELFSISDASANEDGIFTFTVSIDQATDQDVTVLASTAYGTANASDFTAISNQLVTIAAGQTSATVTVSVTNDNVLENDETFTVLLSDPKYNGVTNVARVAIGDGSGTGTILNEDSVKIIDDGDSGFSTTGPGWTYTTNTMHYGDDIYYLSAGANPGASASWVFDDLASGTYRVSGHWSTHVNWASNTELTVSGIEGGSVTQTVNQETLTADLNDSGVDWQDLGFFSVDANGTITVTMANELAEGFVVADAMRLERIESSVAITDVSINEDSGTATFTVTLDQFALEGVSVDWSTADGTATAGIDYIASSGTLNFTGNAGETQTITVTLIDDFVVESDETFLVNLNFFISSGNVSLADPTGIATITDNDSASLSIGDITVDENSGIATFAVTLDQTVAGGASVDWSTADGTAFAGIDYTSNSGTLNFAGNAGETQTITVTLNDENIVELNETFVVNLANLVANGNVTLAQTQAVGTIANDDISVMSLLNPSVAELEGDSGTTTFHYVVNISNPLDVDFHIWGRALDDTATEADGDFTDPHIGYWGTITAGATSAAFQYSTNGDTKIEDHEFFKFAFPRNAIYSDIGTATPLIAAYLDNITFTGADQSTLWATGVILNDDFVKIIDNGDAEFSQTGSWFTYGGNPTYYQNDYSYTNGGGTGLNTSSWAFTDLPAGTYQISGNWYAHSLRATNIPATISGVVGGTVATTINQEALVQDVFDDGVYWQDLGYFEVDSNGTITITLSDDQTNGNVLAEAFRIDKVDSRLSIGDVSINEDAGTATLTVTSSAATGAAFTVDYSTADGTAIAGSDYTATSGTLNFVGTADETQTITVTLTNDNTVELGEKFLVNLSNIQNPSHLNIALEDSQATVTIINDDTTVMSLASTNVSQSEGDSGTTLLSAVINITNPLDFDLHVWSPIIDNTATVADGDFVDPQLGAWATISAGATSTTIQFSISGDTKIEADEVFTFAFVSTFYSAISPLTVLSEDYSNSISFAGGVETLFGTGTIINDDFVKIIDNGDAGFSQTGSWFTYGGNPTYYQNDYSYTNGGGTGLNTSSWAFTDLPAGTYRISGNWYAHSVRATNIPVTISGVVGGNVTTTINQEALVQDVFDDGVYWQDIGSYEVDGNGTITVTISDDQTNGNVLAEAFRLELINPLMAANGQSGSNAPASTQADLNSVRDAALNYWESTGLTEAQLSLLESVEFVLYDLPDAMLGGALDTTILIDVNAAGYGWFVDTTPFDNSEFTLDTNGNLIANAESAASGRMDLLTVVMHELGHILGHDHEDEDDLMGETLDFSERHLPEVDDFFMSLVEGDNPLLN